MHEEVTKISFYKIRISYYMLSSGRVLYYTLTIYAPTIKYNYPCTTLIIFLCHHRRLIYFYITYNNVQRLIIQLNIYYKISNRLDISLAGSSSTSSTFYPEGTGRTSSYTTKSTSRLFNILAGSLTLIILFPTKKL